MNNEILEKNYDEYEVVKTLEDGINTSIIFTSDDHKYVFKIFSSMNLDTSDYFGCMRLVDLYIKDGTKLRVPELADYGIYDNKVYVIYKYIDGDIYNFHSLKHMNMHEEFLEKVVDVLFELHSLDYPVEEFGWFTADEKNNIKVNYPALFSR